MRHPILALIEQRISVNLFDRSHALAESEIGELVQLATRAPTAFNLQNWRFIAVQTPEAKARLQSLAYNQVKVSEAAVTFVICGLLPDAPSLSKTLRPFVDSGHMSDAIASSWQEGARTLYSDPQTARDEAVRSATFGAATLMYAAEAMGLASGPMIGFDAAALAQEFSLEANEVPALLLPVGRAMPENWPQKPRRPLSEVLQIS